MKLENKLPVVKKAKKINRKKFITLAKRVRKAFEEEAKYWEERARKSEDNNPYRFLIDS